MDMETNVNIINSGSDGNAVVLYKKILVDCGIPFKRIRPFLKELKIVLLTHIHSLRPF